MTARVASFVTQSAIPALSLPSSGPQYEEGSPSGLTLLYEPRPSEQRTLARELRHHPSTVICLAEGLPPRLRATTSIGRAAAANSHRMSMLASTPDAARDTGSRATPGEVQDARRPAQHFRGSPCLDERRQCDVTRLGDTEAQHR